MSLKRNINIYKQPLNKSQSFILQKHHEYNSFFKGIFGNVKYKEVVEELYIKKYSNSKFCSLVRVFKPNDKEKKINGYLSLRDFDRQFDIKIVRKEIKLSYATYQEMQYLNIADKDMVVIEKNKLINEKNKVIRYEEIVSLFNTFVYEG